MLSTASFAILAVDIAESWGNFHSSWGRAQDYKIRHAVRDTPLWGAYMTDIIKDHPELVAANVQAYLAQNPDVERKHVQNFKQELKDIGAEKPKLIAFGNVVHNILTTNLSDEFEVSEEIYESKMDAIQDNLERAKKMEVLEDFIWENYFQ
mgnify:CR=1 FL=1